MTACAQVVTIYATIPKHAQCVFGMTQHEPAKVINTWVKDE